MPPPDSWVEFFPIRSHDRFENMDLLTTYENIGEKYFSNARESIVVYELLLKGNNKEPDRFEAYRNAQIEVLGAIEKALELNCDPEKD